MVYRGTSDFGVLRGPISGCQIARIWPDLAGFWGPQTPDFGSPDPGFRGPQTPDFGVWGPAGGRPAGRRRRVRGRVGAGSGPDRARSDRVGTPESGVRGPRDPEIRGPGTGSGPGRTGSDRWQTAVLVKNDGFQHFRQLKCAFSKATVS